MAENDGRWNGDCNVGSIGVCCDCWAGCIGILAPNCARRLFRSWYRLLTCSCKDPICADISLYSCESLKPLQQFGAYTHSRLRFPHRWQGVWPLHFIFRRLHYAMSVEHCKWTSMFVRHRNGPESKLREAAHLPQCRLHQSHAALPLQKGVHAITKHTSLQAIEIYRLRFARC